MKNILVPIEEHSLLPQVLETALLLGRIFDSYVEGLPITLDLPVAMPVDMAIAPPSVLDPQVRREMAAASRHHFEAVMTGEGVPRVREGAAGVSFGWHEGELADDAFLGDYARAFDITVVGRPSAREPRAACDGRVRPLRERPTGARRAADRAAHAGADHHHRLEQKHGDGAHGRFRDAAARARR